MNRSLIGTIDPKDKKITIWGAGFSGLVLGYFFKKNGFKVTIYEKSNHVGGKIATRQTPYGLAETGANALFLNEDALELLKDLNLEILPASPKLKKLLFLKGKPRKALQLKIVSKVAFNALKKPPLISDGLSVSDFFQPLLGNNVIENYLTPALSGIYATPSDKLHFKSLFQDFNQKHQFKSYLEFFKLLIKNKKSKSTNELKGSVSFEGGMQVLIDKLHSYLKEEIKLNSKEIYKSFGNNIICTDALSASELIKNFHPEIANELARIKYQELSSSTVFLKREIKSLQNSFGILLPSSANFNSIGIVNNKGVFPANNANVFAYTLIAKKELNKNAIFHDLNLLHSDLTEEDIEHIEATYWSKAIPIYDLQRFLCIKKISALLNEKKQLAFFGNYVSGISLREMVTAAKNFVSSMMEE